MKSAGPAPANRRILFSLGLSQALNAACVPIALIIASLTVVQLAGGDSRWAGVPAFLTLFGSSLATLTAGRIVQRTGYRRLLMTVCVVGMFGAALAGYASIKEHFAWFLLGLLFLGMAVGVIQLSRYAAAETSPPDARARAMGKVILGSTVGAIAGPLLVGPFGRLAETVGVPALSGPWLAAVLFYLAAMANTWFLLRPEPRELAHRLGLAAVAAAPVTPAPVAVARTIGQMLRERRIALSIGSLVAAQWAMVLVMAITPLHMHTHQHAVPVISFVISAHFVGMFGLSFLSGWLADRVGRMETVGLGGVVLTAACLLAPLSTHPALLMVALFLLGLGWSFCFLGASGTLSEGLAPVERGRIQGFNEALVALTSAVASAGSGLLFAAFGFRNMALVGLAVSFLPCALFLASRVRPATTWTVPG